MAKTDLFGHTTSGIIRDIPHVQIRGNPVLEHACNTLLAMVRADESLLDGDSMRVIDQKLYAEMAWQTEFSKLVDPERKQTFIAAMMLPPRAGSLHKGQTRVAQPGHHPR